MLSPASNRRTRPTSHFEQFDPTLRFECWTVADAVRLGSDPASIEGYAAGRAGAPCPGSARSDAFRMGWEMGAIHAGRIPVPAWMIACNKQAAADCIASA